MALAVSRVDQVSLPKVRTRRFFSKSPCMTAGKYGIICFVTYGRSAARH